MSESQQKLETHRFVIKPESRELVDELRSFVDRLKIQHPEIAGISFFGSRTVGREQGDSDLDFVIFYDYSSIEYDSEKIRNRLGKVVEVCRNFLKERGLRVDAIQSKDVCTRSLNSVIDRFMKDVDDQKTVGQANFGFIFEFFFLGSGHGLYKARKYILDKLERTENGERYFLELMKILKYGERDIKTYKKPDGLPEPIKKVNNQSRSVYPQTIAEARKYFLTE